MVRSFIALFAVLIFGTASFAQQKAEVTISLNEAFFDSALEALFQTGTSLEFSIAENRSRALKPQFVDASFSGADIECSETIKIQREINGVRTAVRLPQVDKRYLIKLIVLM